ncbi:MAG: GerMN domain-containing protein [Chloroflexi bacterium]|nr:GerMN domain-containing protein [Chloroflexota bacterium]
MALFQRYAAARPTQGAPTSPWLSHQGPRRLAGARWLLLVGLLVATGLGLRLAAGQSSLSVSGWLPWLHTPTVTLYFPGKDGRLLVPVARRVAAGEVTPQGAVEHLLRGPTDRARLAPALPPSARLARFELRDGNAVVEVTGELSPTVQTALRRTLLEFPQVKSVRVVSPGAAPEGALPGLQPVYYTYGSYLVPEWKTASGPGGALQLYLAGPGEGLGLQGLPSDVRLVEYRLDAARGLAYVNFTYTSSLRELAIAEPAKMRRILIGIVATLTEFPEVKAVKLDFQGHTALGLGQCSDLLRAPQARPAMLNDEAILARN